MLSLALLCSELLLLKFDLLALQIDLLLTLLLLRVLDFPLAVPFSSFSCLLLIALRA